MATPGTTTRDDPIDRLDAHLDALVVNDPGRLGLGAARPTENGQEIRLDRGPWGTATQAPPPPRRLLRLADPLAGQVAGFAVVSEAGTPVLLAVRLRVVAWPSPRPRGWSPARATRPSAWTAACVPVGCSTGSSTRRGGPTGPFPPRSPIATSTASSPSTGTPRTAGWSWSTRTSGP